MSLQDLLKNAQGVAGGSATGLRRLLEGSTSTSDKWVQAQRDAEAAQFESTQANSFGTIAKGTARGLLDIPVNAAKSTWDILKGTPGKIAEDVKTGAEEFQNREPLSLAKAGFRVAADSANAVFAPLSAAIGSILEASGGQKLTDAVGQKIADKSGITDWPAFQKFAMEHPNAGEDFNRLLTLAMSAAETSKISPKNVLERTALQVRELASKVSREVVRPAPAPTGLRKLTVQSEGVEGPVGLNTSKNRMANYSKEMGYEGYTPDSMLPEIPFGAKGKSAIPSIQMDAPQRGPRAPDGMRYEPIPSPLTVDQVLGNRSRQPVGTSAPGAEIGSVEPRAVGGTGETQTRGLSLGVEAKAIENKLVKNLGDLPEYQVVNMADQAAKASDFMAKDFELAKKVAKGDALPPADLLPEAVFVAVENAAIKAKDVNLLRELATGKLTGEATTMGQRIRTLAERDPESPVTAMKDIVRVREEKAARTEKNIPKAKRQTVNELKKELNKSRPTKQNWNEFIKSITC